LIQDADRADNLCTVVTGIASLESMKGGRVVGLMAIVYFEILTTVACVPRPDRDEVVCSRGSA